MIVPRAPCFLFAMLLVCVSANAQLEATTPTCIVAGDTFKMDFGVTKAPTYVAVIRPDGQMLRLRYPAEHIDTLGSTYAKGRVTMQRNQLFGVDGEGRRQRVFTKPGTYRFVMEDANTAEGMEVHRMSCTVTIEGRLAAEMAR